MGKVPFTAKEVLVHLLAIRLAELTDAQISEGVDLAYFGNKHDCEFLLLFGESLYSMIFVWTALRY